VQQEPSDEAIDWSILIPGQELPPVVGEFTWPIADDVEHGWRMMVGTEASPGRAARTRMRLLSTGYLKTDGRKVSKVRCQIAYGNCS
jgi:hypothetical protein